MNDVGITEVRLRITMDQEYWQTLADPGNPGIPGNVLFFPGIPGCYKIPKTGNPNGESRWGSMEYSLGLR